MVDRPERLPAIPVEVQDLLRCRARGRLGDYPALRPCSKVVERSAAHVSGGSSRTEVWFHSKVWPMEMHERRGSAKTRSNERADGRWTRAFSEAGAGESLHVDARPR